MPSAREAAAWKGRETIGIDGEKTGTVERVYLDDATGAPTWASVTPGVFSTRVRVVPVHDAVEEEPLIRLAYDLPTIEAAPDVEAGKVLSPEDEQLLAAHYAPGARGGSRASRPDELTA